MVECWRCTYPSIHFSLDEDTLKITVGCLVCVVCGGGVCLVVVWWCVCVVCGEAWHTLSLLLSLLPLLFPFLFSLLTFFFFFFFFIFFFFSCSFSYSCSCSCSFSFSSFFFLPFYSLFSSLPFTPTNTVQSTDQQTRRPTLRRLNAMWRTVRS